MRLSAWHIVVLVLVVVIIFGFAKLPDVAKSMAQALKTFKREIKDDEPTTPAGSQAAPTDESQR